MRALTPDEIDVPPVPPRRPNWPGTALLVFLLLGFARGCVRARAEECKASWYGAECAGKPMANGKPFDPDAFTCASWDYPLGTRLRVATPTNSVIVVVTDRGPARRLWRAGRKLDLSRAAFAALADTRLGVIKVSYDEVK